MREKGAVSRICVNETLASMKPGDPQKHLLLLLLIYVIHSTFVSTFHSSGFLFFTFHSSSPLLLGLPHPHQPVPSPLLHH